MSGQRQLTQLERAEYDKPAADCMAAHCSLVTQLKSGRQCRAYTAQPEQAGANLATSPHTLLRRGGGSASGWPSGQHKIKHVKIFSIEMAVKLAGEEGLVQHASISFDRHQSWSCVACSPHPAGRSTLQCSPS